jgi:tetratricopeptide (TPR) repeat protein
VPAADDDGPVTAGQSTGDAAAARFLFEAGNWRDAAPALERVASGETGDDEANRQIARFRLGIALYHLGLYHGSLKVFGAVADAPGHYGYREGLQWLAALDAQLPEPAGVVDHLGSYPRLAKEPFRADVRDRVYHLLGWRAYRDRRFEDAASEFAQVDRRSGFYPRSQFMLGMSNVELRKSVPAVKAFGRIVEAVGEDGPGEEAKHLRNLAWISMARTYYTASVHLDEVCAPTVDTSRLSASAKYWAKVEMDSELWADARLEESWIYFMSGDYPHALGSLHNLESGYVAASLYPEADVVRGIVWFALCRYDDAITQVARMRLRYGPIRRELEALIARLGAERRDEEVIAFHEQVRAGRAPVPEILRPIVDATIADRPIRNALDYVRVVGAEQARFQGMPDAFRRSPLGLDLAAGLSLAHDAALRGAAARVRLLLQRRLDDIDTQLGEGAKLIADVHAAELARRLAPPRASASAPTRLAPTADIEHVIWPFDGEFWKDELGSYRQAIVSQCGG